MYKIILEICGEDIDWNKALTQNGEYYHRIIWYLDIDKRKELWEALEWKIGAGDPMEPIEEYLFKNALKNGDIKVEDDKLLNHIFKRSEDKP